MTAATRKPDPLAGVRSHTDAVLISMLSQTLKDAVQRLMIAGEPRRRILAAVRRGGAKPNSLTLLGVEAFMDRIERRQAEIVADVREWVDGMNVAGSR